MNFKIFSDVSSVIFDQLLSRYTAVPSQKVYIKFQACASDHLFKMDSPGNKNLRDYVSTKRQSLTQEPLPHLHVGFCKFAQ